MFERGHVHQAPRMSGAGGEEDAQARIWTGYTEVGLRRIATF